MIGISSPSFSLMPITEIVEEVSKHFGLWEIVAEAEHTIVGRKKEIEDILSSYDLRLQIHAPISDLNIGSLVSGMRSTAFQSLWETMDAAHDLGIETVTLHPGYLSPLGFYAPEKVREITRRTLLDLEKVNRTFGLVLCLENMPGLSIMTGSTAEEISAYIDGTDIGFCMDVGHANTVGGLESFRSLFPTMANVHAHDNDGTGDQHLEVGKGSVDWRGVKKMLKGYNGNIIIESRDVKEGVNGLNALKKIMG